MPRAKRKEVDNTSKAPEAKASVVQNPYKLQKPRVVEDKSTPLNFAVFQLCNGEMKSFVTPVEAQEFADEHQALILGCQYFATKTAMDTYLRTASSPAKMLAATEQVSLADLSPEDKSKFQQIRAALERSKPTSTINFAIKTTKKSLVAIIFIYARDELGRPVWFFKDPLPKVFQQYISAIPTEHLFTNQFLTTLSSVEQRDPEKGPEDAIMTVRKEDNRSWTQKIMWGWVNIQPNNFTSADEEMAWLDAMVRVTWMNAVSMSANPIFRASLQTAMSERMYAAIYKVPKFGPNFPDFMQHCKVNVTRLDNLNSLTILDRVKELQLFLIKNEQGEKKYPNADTVTFHNDTGTKLFPGENTEATTPGQVVGNPAPAPVATGTLLPAANQMQSTPKAKRTPKQKQNSPSKKTPSAPAKPTGQKASQTKTTAKTSSPKSKQKKATPTKLDMPPSKEKKATPTKLGMPQLNIQTLPIHPPKVTPPKGSQENEADDDISDTESENELEALVVEATVLPDDE